MVLTLNTGSSSLKYGLFDLTRGGDAVVEGLVERIGAGGRTHAEALDAVLGALARDGHLAALTAVGHRVVHGGERFRAPTVVTADVEAAIEALTPLAPLHNPANLAGIRAARAALAAAGRAGVPHVAVFDTAFHATLPPEAYRYAVPEEWYADYGVRKYGFHGTSHAYVSARAREVLAQAQHPHARLVTLHLGNGCSAAAIRDGVCVDTSMGLTPLAGLMMGTRSGDVDPGLGAYLASRGISPEAYDRALNEESGLLGVGGAADMRELLRLREEGSPAAERALGMYVYRIRKTVGAYVAVLGGLDALVFTAGVGEHARAIREEVVAGLGCFGVSPTDEGPARVLVIETREELAIARAAHRALASPA